MNHSIVYRYVKDEWQELWSKKYSDPIICESISNRKYAWLEVEKGEVVQSSKKSNMDFHEILEKNYGLTKDQANPNPQTGGWKKFAKDNFRKKQRREEPKIQVDLSQQRRNHGQGWRNMAREWRKIRESGS